MQVWVAGRDRTADLGAAVAGEAGELAAHADAPGELAPFHSALILRESENAEDYLERLLGLIALQAGAGADDFYIPRRPGLAGRLSASVKRLLWKALRYQHERVVTRQNAVSTRLATALQLVREDYADRIRALEARVRELEGGARR